MSTLNYFTPIESFSPNGELMISFLVPDRKYVVSTVSENLPTGITLADFPDYQPGDLIRVIVVVENNTSIPGDTELVQPMNLFESFMGEYVNVMVYSDKRRKHNVIRVQKKCH